MIEQTEAIVLSARRYSETSKIVTLYTRSRGTLGVMAKGAMRPKSPLAGILDPLGYLGVSLAIKEGRDLQLVTAAETVERFALLRRDFDRLSAGLEVVEIVRAVITEPEPNHVLFEAILRALRALDDADTEPSVVSLRFHIVLIEVLGYALRLDGCGVCDDPIEVGSEGLSFGIADGSPLCEAHADSDGSYQLSASAVEAFELLSSARFSRLSEYQIDPAAIASLRGLLARFLQFHVPGIRRLKVGAIVASMGGASGKSL